MLMMMLNKMMYPKILFKAYKTKLLVRMLGWKKQMRRPNVNGETSFIDPGKDLSIQGGVKMNNATPLEGSSVILGEQDIVHDVDD